MRGLLLFTLLLTAFSVISATQIGFKESKLANADDNRPLHVAFWYPTSEQGPVVSVGESRSFYGFRAIRNAQPTGEPHPLVVLSHGYGGDWRSLGWLAAELVREGYIVAAPNHPGTTALDKNKAQAARLWERPHDLSRIINGLMDNPTLAGTVMPERIAAIGHSLGGWTVIASGGARFSTERFLQDCSLHPDPWSCGLAEELGITRDNKSRLDGSLADSRIGAVISFDPGFARGFTPESLATLPVPALIIGAGIGIGDLPVELESGYIAAHLPPLTSSYAVLPDALHFSFMPLCRPETATLSKEGAPGGGIVCKDAVGSDRSAIHQRVTGMVMAFLKKTFHRELAVLNGRSVLLVHGIWPIYPSYFKLHCRLQATRIILAIGV